ncbi:hypothetical protein H0H92_012079, partial [Tricholoma furcatifolium]
IPPLPAINGSPSVVAVLLCILFAACISSTVGLDFGGANWIWIPGREADGITYPPGNVSFCRDFTPTNGKVPISADVLITTDDAYTFYVNGKPIGTGIDFRYAQRYCVPLSYCCNVFAVEGQNYQPNAPGNAAGLIAAIQVCYSDGFMETITDAEWHAVNGSPAGFQEVAYDDSSWAPAFIEGPYPLTVPWNSYTISISPPDQNPGPSLRIPVGARAFHKTINIPNGGLVVQAHVLIATDNDFTLYINGLLVGSGSSYTTAYRYLVNLPLTSTVTIAVYAVNSGGPAGVFAAFELITCDCSNNVYGVTDKTWKFNLGIPDGFIQPGYNDGAWGSAVAEGSFGSPTWGPTTAPAANSPVSCS